MVKKMTTRIQGNEIVLEREFDAPKELVFKAFSEAQHLKHWWGPRGWILTVCEIDFREGGVWHYCMKCVDENQGDFYGFESWGKGVYKEIVHGEKVVYMDYFSDEEGNESDQMPATLCTLIFKEQDGKTTVINRGEYVSAEALQAVMEIGMEQGISETWDRLAEYLVTLK